MDIHIEHVSKKFKENQLFEDVNLTLSDGRIYGFIGRNGSGKSVLFKMIGGYMYPDHGTITVDGKTIGKDLDFPDKMGALIENPGFMWHETGFENIGYFCRRFKKLYGVTPINYRKYYRSAERNSMRNTHSDTNVLSG